MKGFTLIEILVAIVIVGILAAISIPTYLRQVERAREVEVILLLDWLATSIEEYRLLNNAYPADVGSGVAIDIAEWPTSIPFDSVLDYDHWGIGDDKCAVMITHFGRNGTRDTPVHQRAGEVGSIVRIEDDFIKVVAEYECDHPVGGIR